jgi:hypothetical protein
MHVDISDAEHSNDYKLLYDSHLFSHLIIFHSYQSADLITFWIHRFSPLLSIISNNKSPFLLNHHQLRCSFRTVPLLDLSPLSLFSTYYSIIHQ